MTGITVVWTITDIVLVAGGAVVTALVMANMVYKVIMESIDKLMRR